jgi:hypothetical protein
MRFSQSLLGRIPDASIRLFVVLAIFAAVVVMSFAILDGSGHHSDEPHGQAESHSKG